SRYSYVNSDFFLLSAVIEKVTGKHFKDVLKEMILSPANMMYSGEEESDPIQQEAKGYVRQDGSIESASPIDLRNTEGNAGMYSTAEDLFRWSRFFQYKLSTDKFLKDAIKPFMIQDAIPSKYSSGWCLFPDYIFHFGHINGFANLFTIDTVHHLTIVI